MTKPLENIKILDLTRVLAGPFCTMIISDLGAEVIKIEVPETGDDSRIFGPFKNNKSLYFVSINREKKSVSVNLKTEKGKKIIRDLAKVCDVVVENFRPGTMEKLGIGYEDLKKDNPRLIYASSSGFGQTGPMSPKAAYDILVQAMGGVMSITGWPDTPPTRVGMSLGDISAGLYTTIGILSALYQRSVTGLGQQIDIAMLDCQVSILENAIVRYQVEKVAPQPIGNRHPTITPFQAFQASDGYLVVGIGNESLWLKFCDVIGCPELKNHAKYASNQLRSKHLNDLIPLLEDVFITKTVNEWLCVLDKAGIPCGPINTIDHVMENEQVKARNMIVDVEDKEIGNFKIAGNPIKMTNLPEEKLRGAAPSIGEHNVEILSQYLGLSIEEINALKTEGVL